MTEPTLHPNLAKLAAAYDEILERLQRGQITTVTARSEIAQLEARDDEGVRWNIDPDSGEWVRKTALGDYEYDQKPPTYGYMTPDAFDYTANPQVFNPSDRLQMAAVQDHLETGPSGLAGATRAQSAQSAAKKSTGLPDRLAQLLAPLPRLVADLPGRIKLAAAAVLVVLVVVVLHPFGSSAPDPTDTPPTTQHTAHPGKHKNGKHAKHAKHAPPAKPKTAENH